MLGLMVWILGLGLRFLTPKVPGAGENKGILQCRGFGVMGCLQVGNCAETRGIIGSARFCLSVDLQF